MRTCWNPAHVVVRPRHGEPEAAIKRLGVRLRGERDFPRADFVCFAQEESHQLAADPLPSQLRDRRHPGDQRLTAARKRRRQPSGGRWTPPRSTIVTRRHSSQCDDASSIVWIGHAQIGDVLLLGEDAPPDLEHVHHVGRGHGAHDFQR